MRMGTYPTLLLLVLAVIDCCLHMWLNVVIAYTSAAGLTFFCRRERELLG